MIFSRRDYTMVMMIVAVLLIGLGYLIAAPMIGQWREAASLRERLNKDRAVAERLLNTRGEWEAKLGEARANLPRYGMTEAVGAELLRQVRRLADENKVATTRITPDVETSIGDLYEIGVEVAWEAALDPLVRFLYAVQIAGATLDIRQMTMTPSQGNLLKGNLKMFFAYQRAEAAPAAPTAEAGP